jgi:hypothetical protein
VLGGTAGSPLHATTLSDESRFLELHFQAKTLKLLDQHVE